MKKSLYWQPIVKLCAWLWNVSVAVKKINGNDDDNAAGDYDVDDDNDADAAAKWYIQVVQYSPHICLPADDLDAILKMQFWAATLLKISQHLSR